MQWQVLPFPSLSLLQLHDLLRLRADVFVVEQQCIYPDLDGRDPEALHILGHMGTDMLVAYARIIHQPQERQVRIGRVVVHPSARGLGLAHRIMQQAERVLYEQFSGHRAILSAQAHLHGLYAAHGFKTISAVYDLDGIPHVDMARDVVS